MTLSPGELHGKLRQQGYHLTPTLCAQVEAAIAARPTGGAFLTGPAGSGKTFLAEAVASAGNCETFFFQAFPGCRKEELYQTIVPDASQPSGFRTLAGVLPQAATASKQAPTALILDEWDKTHPSTDAFLLDFLQNGRISVPGSQVMANQEQLIVFLTLNDERELSEPLLRRLPMLELLPNPTELVHQALKDTHPEHPLLGAAVALYQRSQLVSLSKPVTIQELRQLLDAISLLGEQSDWNRLVFQFITKNWDDHEILKSAEALPAGSDPVQLERERVRLNPQAYTGEDLAPSGLEEDFPSLPRVHRDWLRQFPQRELEYHAEGIYGVVPRTESGYDGMARALLSRHNPVANPGQGTLPADPAHLGFAQVGDQEIIVYESLNFARVEEWGLVLKDGAELLLSVDHGGEISTNMLQEFKAGSLQRDPEDPDRCRIYSLSATELLMRYKDTKIRWTPRELEIVTRDYQATRELWEFIYGPQGIIQTNRRALQAHEARQQTANAAPELAPNDQLREDYLFVLREYRHLQQWFTLLINRNVRVWDRITCSYRNNVVQHSRLSAAQFNPDQEAPKNKEEAESISVYRALHQPVLDYYESNINQLESELVQFVAKNGEFPPAVEDGGIFGLHEVHSDLVKIKREGLKMYMRKVSQEV